MVLQLIAQYSDLEISLTRKGDSLTINGEVFDFAPLQSGSTIPVEAISCNFIAGDVVRDSAGVLRIPIILPIRRSVFHDTLPDIEDPSDGPIELPTILEEYDD